MTEETRKALAIRDRMIAYTLIRKIKAMRLNDPAHPIAAAHDAALDRVLELLGEDTRKMCGLVSGRCGYPDSSDCWTHGRPREPRDALAEFDNQA